MKHVLVIPGDGIGPEVILPSVEIMRAISSDIDFEFAEAGKEAFEKNGEAISEEVLDKAGKADAIFFGATTSVRDAGYRSPILELRKKLDLYANVRPVKTLLPGMKNIDMVIIRENTEGLYSGLEEQSPDGVTTFRKVTTKGCERIVKFAFAWCEQHSRRRIVCVHKANVLRLSDGMFLDVFNHEAARNKRFSPSDMLVDSTALKMAIVPEDFDVIVTLNLYGDILSDLGAGLVGGLGFAPSANIGDRHALFEPAHGSAPDIAGKGIANPFASLMSGQMMLEHLGQEKERQILSLAVGETVGKTRDLFDQQGRCDTRKAIESVKANLKNK